MKIKLTSITFILCLLRFTVIGQNETICSGCNVTKMMNTNELTLPLEIEKKWEFNDSVSDLWSPILIDIDNDCIPEIITPGQISTYYAFNIINIYSTLTKSNINTISTFHFYLGDYVVLKTQIDYQIIIHALDNDPNPSHVRGRLVCFNSDSSIAWISDSKLYPTRGEISLADFNMDGIPEVYKGNQIFNAKNGILLANGGNHGKGSCLYIV